MKLLGLVVITIATLVIIFRNKCAESIISSQNKTWGFHFTEKSVRQTEIQLIVIMIGGIIMGILMILGVGKK